MFWAFLLYFSRYRRRELFQGIGAQIAPAAFSLESGKIKNSITEFLDVVTTHNNLVSIVKHVLHPVYVVFLHWVLGAVRLLRDWSWFISSLNICHTGVTLGYPVRGGGVPGGMLHKLTSRFQPHRTKVETSTTWRNHKKSDLTGQRALLLASSNGLHLCVPMNSRHPSSL